MMNNKSDDLITRFLLGELSEEERAEVEKRCLSDNDFFEEVLSAEDDLMDQYVLGRLSGDRLERAESLFRSSHGQRRDVGFTEGLIASLREAEPGGKTIPAVRPATPAEPVNKSDAEEEFLPAPPGLKNSRGPFSFITAGLRSLFPRLAPLAVSLVCLSLIVWVVYRYSQRRGPAAERLSAELSSKQEEPRREQSGGNRNGVEPGGQVVNERVPQGQEKEPREKARDLIAQAPARKPGRTSSILLTPAAPERGAGPQTPIFKIEPPRVRLQLALNETRRYSRFRVLITTFEGRKIWSKDLPAASQVKRGRLTLSLPSSLFGHEDYRIELKGLTDDGASVHVADYIFKVRN